MNSPIHVLIADSQPLIRQGLRAVFAATPDIQIVAEAGDGLQALELVRECQPKVLLLDLRMPRKDGLAVLSELRRTETDTRVLVLTSFTDKDSVLGAIRAGADGFLPKETTADELVAAVRVVARGESALHPAIAGLLMGAYREPGATHSACERLTPTERHVLHLLADGLTNRELARELNVSVRTITTHVGSILAKLGVANRTRAALYAREHGIARSPVGARAPTRSGAQVAWQAV